MLKMFQRQEKNEKSHLLLILSRNPGPERCLLKKKRKRNVNDVPSGKKSPHPNLPL